MRLEFYAGNRRKIEHAIRNGNFDLLHEDSEFVNRIADFSLHITPRDLNLLSRQFGKHSGQKPRDLRPDLKVLIDEKDHGLLLVNHKWGKYVANVDVGKLDVIVLDWFEAMRNTYPDEAIAVTEAAQEAVHSLIVLCQECVHTKTDVLHAWSL